MIIQQLQQFANPTTAGYLIVVSFALYLFAQLALSPRQAGKSLVFVSATSLVVLLIGLGALTLWATQSILAIVVTDLAVLVSAPIQLAGEMQPDTE